jgi:hypothetical protein
MCSDGSGWIRGGLNMHWPGDDINSRTIVGGQFFYRPANHLNDSPGKLLHGKILNIRLQF